MKEVIKSFERDPTDSEKDLECCICMNQFDGQKIIELKCSGKHKFHSDCLEKWVESKPSCPICRGTII